MPWGSWNGKESWAVAVRRNSKEVGGGKGKEQGKAGSGMDQTGAGAAPKAAAGEDRTGTRYGKEQILGSLRYRGQRDLACALLEEGGRYSLDEVDGLLEDYLKGMVM